MKQNPPRKHHYVPRCYFRPWENNFREVLVYQRKSDRVLPPFWQSTKRICVHPELYSYTASVEEAKRNLIEQRLFSLIDTRAARVLGKLQVPSDPLDITETEAIDFSVFLVSLRARTPEFFLGNALQAEADLRRSLTEAENDPKVQDLRPMMKGRTFLEFAEQNFLDTLENAGREILANLITKEKFFQPIYNLKWAVTHIPTQDIHRSPLVTSDRPLVSMSVDGKPRFLALPLSPNALFIASSNEADIERIRRYSRIKLARKANESVVQQAQAKAFARDNSHKSQFFERRLGKFHSVMPYADQIPIDL